MPISAKDLKKRAKAKRAGRPRAEGHREPSGRLPSRKIERAETVRAVALSQPHRRVAVRPASDWRGTALGRLLEDTRYLPAGVSRSALYEAGTRYAESYRAMLAATENRQALAKPTPSAGPMSDETARLAIQAWALVSRALRHYSPRCEKTVGYVCCEHNEETWVPPFWVETSCIEGLLFLARDHYQLAWEGEDRT